MANVDDLEEGEICSDEEGEEKDVEKQKAVYEAYNVVQRPETSKFIPGGQQYRNTAAEDIKYSSDEEDNSADSSDNDSPIVKKSIRKELPKTDSSYQGAHKQDTNWVANVHGNIMQEKLKGKKPNNIWGNVLEEETMSRYVNQLNRNEDISYTERGAESYDYTRSKLDPRFENASESSESSEESEEEDTGPADLTSKETFGFDIDKKPKKPSVKSRLGKKEKTEEGDESNSHSSDKGSGGDNNMEVSASKPKKKNRHKKKKRRSGDKNKMELGDGKFDARDVLNKGKSETMKSGENGDLRNKMNRKRRHNGNQGRGNRFYNHSNEEIMNVEVKPMKLGVNVSTEMEDMELADTILDALREPADKIDIFLLIIEQLSAEKTIKLFKATEDIEEMGGLMIQNGARRRTPGGVFLYLVRTDCDVTKAQLDVIFAEQNAAFKAQKKENKKLAQHRKKRGAGEAERKAAYSKAEGMEVSDKPEAENEVASDTEENKTNEQSKIEENGSGDTAKKESQETDFDLEETDDAINIELS